MKVWSPDFRASKPFILLRTTERERERKLSEARDSAGEKKKRELGWRDGGGGVGPKVNERSPSSNKVGRGTPTLIGGLRNPALSHAQEFNKRSNIYASLCPSSPRLFEEIERGGRWRNSQVTTHRRRRLFHAQQEAGLAAMGHQSSKKLPSERT